MSVEKNKPGILYWVIVIIGLLWNAMGVDAYINQAYKTERFKSMYSQEQLELINNLPIWYTAVFAIAVFASFIGAFLLLVRKKIAVPTLFIGLIAVIIQTGYNLFLNPGKEMYGTMEYSMLILIPLFSLFLYWYAKKCASKSILF